MVMAFHNENVWLGKLDDCECNLSIFSLLLVIQVD